MSLQIINRNTHESQTFPMFSSGSMPVGFYKFVADQLYKYRDIEFVKFELIFKNDVVEQSFDGFQEYNVINFK